LPLTRFMYADAPPLTLVLWALFLAAANRAAACTLVTAIVSMLYCLSPIFIGF
jgi:hypothetical protein